MIEDVKRIPYGVSNFVEVVEQNQYYVDKTMYLPLLEQQPNSLFFIRPRRFGKSIFLSMLRTYYDIYAYRYDPFHRINDVRPSSSFCKEVSQSAF